MAAHPGPKPRRNRGEKNRDYQERLKAWNRALAAHELGSAYREYLSPESRHGNSRWTPAGGTNPDVGVLEGTDHVVSFKTDGSETIIADGDYSTGRAASNHFDKHHDHYGPKTEGGWIDKVRGFFSG